MTNSDLNTLHRILVHSKNDVMTIQSYKIHSSVSISIMYNVFICIVYLYYCNVTLYCVDSRSITVKDPIGYYSDRPWWRNGSTRAQFWYIHRDYFDQSCSGFQNPLIIICFRTKKKSTFFFFFYIWEINCFPGSSWRVWHLVQLA